MNKKLYCDLGNARFKGIYNDRKIVSCSNVEVVKEGTFGAFEIDGKYYIIGEGARSKKSTNKIIEEKRALLGRELFTLVDTDKEKVDVVCLLPLSLYTNLDNRKAYADLLKGNYKVTSPAGVKKQFTVSNVEVCAETYSSILTNKDLVKQSVYLVDIGGCDNSGVRVNNGVPDVNLMYTKEQGMNIFYTGLARVLTSKLLDTYIDKDAEILYEKYDELPEEIKATIDTYAETYIQSNIIEPLKEIGFKELLFKICVVGGGAKALERYLVKNQSIVILDECIFSNVLGAKIISTRRSK